MALPTGQVTFLFTDIEGSTELLTALGNGYALVLERHNELLRGAFVRHGGIDLMSQGDSLFAVFESATDAVAAAIEAQRLVAAEPWPSAHPVYVRMGLHSGIGMLGADGYVGLDVHRAARVSSAANGGQILASDPTRALAESRLGDEVSWLDMGRHRLKGLPEPERIYQVSGAGLRTDFPPIHSLEAHPHNLPRALTSFIGREEEIADLHRQLADTRLLTLTGPGGTGKTRLAIRLAEEVVAEYTDGCFFVGLDDLRDPQLVPASIADALKLKLAADRPVVDALATYLADRQVLLVLDNFEQVAGAAADIVQLLRATARVRALATSRVPLHVYGEHEYLVAPLVDEAVELFVERATAVRQGFTLTNENAADIAQICERLDGLPLAIELAAARIKLLTPSQILARLAHRLELAWASHDAPERQRTLRGAIDWSYDLLPVTGQRLLAALAVFRGGFTLESAEKVLGDAGLGLDILDGLGVLVDNSLVRVDATANEARYSMLETIREYARERLDKSEDATALTRVHARHFFDLAVEAGEHLVGRDQPIWLARLDREADNLRAGFSRAPAVELLDDALVAAGSMWRYWQLRGHFTEARQVLDRLLGFEGGADAARQKALTGAGGIAYWQADATAMAAYYQEALDIAERLGDPQTLAEALNNASFVPVSRGDFAAARPMLERSARLYRDLGQETAAIDAEGSIGWSHLLEGEPRAALNIFEAMIRHYRNTGAVWQLADGLAGVALAQARLGDWEGMARSLGEAMATFALLDYEVGLAQNFELAAAICGWVGDAPRAARLVGRARAIIDAAGGGRPILGDVREAPFHELARAALGDERFNEYAAEGAQMANDAAVELAKGLRVPEGTDPMPLRTAFVLSQ